MEPYEGWWGEVEHNLTRAELTPIQNPATALAALLSGDVDYINPVPIQDVARLKENPDVQVIQGIEARVIMLGFPHAADALKSSSETTEANPFADPRVRPAVAHAMAPGGAKREVGDSPVIRLAKPTEARAEVPRARR